MRYGRQLQSILRLACHVLILDASGREVRNVDLIEPEDRRIDVWWWEDGSSRLGLLLAYMMTRSAFWEASTIRILAPCAINEEAKTTSHMRGVLRNARIEAEIKAVPDADASSMVEHSADASIVFFRIELEGMRTVGPFGDSLEELLDQLPISCMVAAASSIKLSEPEEIQAPDQKENEEAS